MSRKKCSKDDCPTQNLDKNLTVKCHRCEGQIHLSCYGIEKNPVDVFITKNIVMLCDECLDVKLDSDSEQPSPKRKRLIQRTMEAQNSILSLSNQSTVTSPLNKNVSASRQQTDDIEIGYEEDEDDEEVSSSEVLNDGLVQDSVVEEYDSDSEEDETNESATSQPQEPAAGEVNKNAEVTKWIGSNGAVPFGNLICSFPATAMEFLPLSGGYKTKVFHPLQFYEFTGNGNQLFYIAVKTIKHLMRSKDGKIKNVEIEFLSDINVELHQQQLKDKLKDANLSFTSILKKGVFLSKKCTWSTLVLLSKLDLGFEIVVSGGGFGEFCKLSQSRRTSYVKQSSYMPDGFQIRTEMIKIGVIDTGCLPPQAFPNSGVCIHETMWNTNFKTPKYTQYIDNKFTHGTAIVELLNELLLPKSKVFVARVSQDGHKKIDAKKLISAMEEFKNKVHVINCSFSGSWDSAQLFATIKRLQSLGIIIISSSGNQGLINTDFKNENTILVGSHNETNSVSSFTNCKVDICGLGENIQFKTVLPSNRTGTSYAVPLVSALAVNYMSFTSINESAILKNHLVATAENLLCWCKDHNGQLLKLKLNPIGLMETIKRDDYGPTPAKLSKIDNKDEDGISDSKVSQSN